MLSQQAKEVQATHDTVKEEVTRKSKELDAALHEDSRRTQELQGELSSVCSRLEKVTGKRAKLETEIIPLLEAKLLQLRNELEQLQTNSPSISVSQAEEEDFDETWNVRNWVPPIQRPPPNPKLVFPAPSGFNTATDVLRQSSSRLTHMSGFKPTSSASLPLFPSYDPNFSLRAVSSPEESTHPIDVPSPRTPSELKSGNAFHTIPRLQSQNVSHLSTHPFDFVVRRPSPNPTNGC
jgi:hypothetical protein